jgi:hypothetical protein
MKKLTLSLISVSVLVASGCATSPDEIRASSVSPLRYANHSCEQIVQEAAYVEEEVNSLYYSLKKKADDDSTQMGLGLILFWPALFFLEGGDGPQAAEYAKYKGEHKALQRAAITKSCSTKIDSLPTPEEAAEKMKKEAEAEKQES